MIGTRPLRCLRNTARFVVGAFALLAAELVSAQPAFPPTLPGGLSVVRGDADGGGASVGCEGHKVEDGGLAGVSEGVGAHLGGCGGWEEKGEGGTRQEGG